MPVQPKKPAIQGNVTANLAPLKPGQFKKLPEPNISLSPAAQALLPNAETQARAKELRAKIKAYEAEILRLKAARQKVDKDLADASSQQKKLEGINPKLLKYFSYIEKNCSEFLASVRATNKLLFRGQDDTEHPVFVGYPRENRSPKDSDIEAQRLFDQYLTTMGFKALRSNSIFTSSDDSQAGNYGTVYAIFPKNGFSFTWSTKEEDLVMNSVSYVDPGAIDVEDTYENLNIWSEEFDDIEDHIRYYSGLPNNNLVDKEIAKIEKSPAYKSLRKAIVKWNNIDISDGATIKDVYKQFLVIAAAYQQACVSLPILKKLLGTSDRSAFNKDIAKATKALTRKDDSKVKVEVKVKAAAFIKKHGFIHENLPAALKSGHEICVLGEYVAVNWEEYEEELIKYFLTPKKAPKK